MDWGKYKLNEAHIPLAEALATLHSEGAFSESLRDLKPRLQVALGKRRNGASIQVFEDAGIIFEGTNRKRGSYMVNNLAKLRTFVQNFRTKEYDDINPYQSLVQFLLEGRGIFRFRDFERRFRHELRHGMRGFALYRAKDKGEGLEKIKNTLLVRMPEAAMNIARREHLHLRLANLPNDLIDGKTLAARYPDSPIWDLWTNEPQDQDTQT